MPRKPKLSELPESSPVRPSAPGPGVSAATNAARQRSMKDLNWEFEDFQRSATPEEVWFLAAVLDERRINHLDRDAENGDLGIATAFDTCIHSCSKKYLSFDGDDRLTTAVMNFIEEWKRCQGRNLEPLPGGWLLWKKPPDAAPSLTTALLMLASEALLPV